MRIYVYLCMYVRVVLMQVLKVYWVCVLTPYNITNHVTRGAGGGGGGPPPPRSPQGGFPIPPNFEEKS